MFITLAINQILKSCYQLDLIRISCRHWTSPYKMRWDTKSKIVVLLQVNEILSRSTVWSAFKDQKHDLFISESQTAGFLTGIKSTHAYWVKSHDTKHRVLIFSIFLPTATLFNENTAQISFAFYSPLAHKLTTSLNQGEETTSLMMKIIIIMHFIYTAPFMRTTYFTVWSKNRGRNKGESQIREK